MSVLLGVPGGAFAAGACPGGQPCIVVHLEGSLQATRVVTLADIEQWHDLPNTTYQLRSEAGGPTQDTAAFEPLSVRQLVVELGAESGGPMAGLSVDQVTFVELADPRSSYVSTLGGQNLGASGQNGYAQGLMPAVFAAGSDDSMGYVRPLTSDAGDVNVQDFIQGNFDGALDLTLHTEGTLLRPTVQASATQVDADAPVSFSVSFASPPGGSVSYDWSFSDGTSSTQAAPSHTWSAAGSYPASVRVRGADGSYGQSNAVLVTVGPKPTPSAGPSPGGGSTGDPDNPSTGPQEGGGSQGGGQIANPTANASPGAGATSAPSAAPTASATAAVGPTASGAGPTSSPTGRPDEPGRGDQESPSPGDVQGLLLSAADAPAPSAVEAGEPATAPAARRGADAPVDPLVWWAAAAPLLLLAGIASEAGWLRRAVRRTSWSGPSRSSRSRSRKVS